MNKIIFKKMVKISLIGLLLISVFSCKKPGIVSYPTSTNYGENIFNMSDGKLTYGESYSMEANLAKNSSLEVVITNLSEKPDSIYTQEARWAYDFIKGWKPDNYVNKIQKFTSYQVGNNDMKLVFVGTNGICKIQVYENGGAEPKFTKNFTW
jgi:hypothetical protein